MISNTILQLWLNLSYQIRLSISRIRELRKFRIDVSAGKVKIHSDFSPLEYENMKFPDESQVQQYAKEAESWKLRVGANRWETTKFRARFYSLFSIDLSNNV